MPPRTRRTEADAKPVDELKEPPLPEDPAPAEEPDAAEGDAADKDADGEGTPSDADTTTTSEGEGQLDAAQAAAPVELVTVDVPCATCYPDGWPDPVQGAYASCSHYGIRFGETVTVPK